MTKIHEALDIMRDQGWWQTHGPGKPGFDPLCMTNALTNAIGLSAIGNLFGSGSAYSGVTGGAGPLSVPTLPA